VSDEQDEPTGDAWVKGEAGVLPKGLAAAARARLDQQRERIAAARDGGDAPTPDPSRTVARRPSDATPAPQRDVTPGVRPSTSGGASSEPSPGTRATEPRPAPGRSRRPEPESRPQADPEPAPGGGDVLGLATQVVTAGIAAPVQGEPFLRGPVFAGPYHAAGDVTDAPHVYGRMSNPGFERYEQALAGLDGGRSVVFASGMAAATAVLQTLLGPGDLLVAPNDGYPGVLQYAREHLATRGVGVRTVPTTDEAIRRAAKGSALVWIETPANPGLQVLELGATIAACQEAGARVVVDNTLATPLRQRPLDLGADLVVSSDSKHLTGHSDLILGHVSGTDADLVEQLRRWRTLAGAVPGPFEIWLAHRSLGTLDVRLRRQEAVAVAVHGTLAAREDLEDVRYPGFSSVVGFDLGSMGRAKRFLAALDLVAEATSFGGMHSTAERRDRFGDGQVGPGYIRFSAGLETPGDVVADLTRALDATG
jgi:cystathionine gamma-lyase